jgi:molybdopterin molybdotransferase
VTEHAIDVEEARRRVTARVRPLASHPVALADALDRVLATDVSAEQDVPGYDNSAMDGVAVVAEDTEDPPAVLGVIGESRAGRPARVALTSGHAIRISTGAMLPQGADAVVRVEDTRGRPDAGIEVFTTVAPGHNVRRAGEDIRAREVVLRAGTRVGPAELGVLAAVGVEAPACARRPRVSVLTTGDELLAPGEPLRPGAIYDSNRFSIAAQAQRAGADVVRADALPDDLEATVAGLREALRADAVVICGGVSVGEHDHVKPALARLGVDEEFWRVALRPGHPTWFGVSGQGALVFGLPGNPVSAMVTFHLFVRPALLALVGAPDVRPVHTATFDDDYAKAPGRTHALRCKLDAGPDGWHVRPTGPQGSHVLTSMLGAQALAILEADRGDVRAGDAVTIELLA